MKIDEAIIIISECRFCNKKGSDNQCLSTNGCFEAKEMAINALEKQIPKKPINISKVKDADTYIGNIGQCPYCKTIIDDDRFVCDCGQKLDWSEE